MEWNGLWSGAIAHLMHQLGYWLRQRSHRFSVLIAVGLSVSLAIGACSTETTPTSVTTSPSATPAPQAQVIRIGYQKFGTLNIVKARGGLEKRLEPLGVTVEWSLFPAGPQLLEGLNVESIDLGHTGEAPPIFAQAAGTPLVYVGNEPASPASEAILVPANSSIKTVADLKGKKVVLNKGSNVHYLLVRAIEEAGLQLSDIESIFLPPADARVAFEQGAADAWVIWDPFFAAAEQQIGAKVLRDGQGLVANREFYLGSRSFAAANPKLIEEVLAEISAVDDWAEANPDQVAEILSPQLNIDVPTLKTVVQRRDYGVEPISDAVLEEQQKIADTFAKLQLIPKSIDVKEATL